MANIGAYHISSEAAINAIMTGLANDPRFKNAAKRLSRTVQGELSTLGDYSQRLFGQIMMSPFRAFRRQMPAVIATVQQMGKAIQHGGWAAMMQVLDDRTGSNGRVVGTWRLIAQYAGILGRVIRDVLWPALRDVSTIVGGALYVVLRAFGDILGFRHKAHDSAPHRYDLHPRDLGC
jgi:hypothetical protein